MLSNMALIFNGYFLAWVKMACDRLDLNRCVQHTHNIQQSQTF